MHDFLKALPLAFPVILAACGVASPDNPNVGTLTDAVAPTVISVTPDNNADIALDMNSFTVGFSEPMKKAQIEAPGSITVEPTLANFQVSYNEEANTATISWDKVTLPYNADYRIDVSGALADLAGNKLVSGKTYVFHTPKAVELSGYVSGLAYGQTLSLYEEISKTTVTVNSSSSTNGATTAFKLPKLLPSGTKYRLVLAAQPSKTDFCSVISGSGTAGSQSFSLNVQCGKVLPVFASAPNWNDYISLNSVTDPTNPLKASGAACDPLVVDRCYHAGEMRKAYVPAALIASDTNCTDLKARDHLGWFNWQCVDDSTDDAGRFRMVATKLKDSVNLSNLVLANSLMWQSNMVMFENTKTGLKDENIGTAAPWWHNPITEGTSPSLDQAGTVYVLKARTGGNFNTNAYRISANRVAAFTTGGSLPPITIQSTVTSEYLNYIWIEAEVAASGRETGLSVSNTRFVMVRNTTVTGAEGAGITLNGVGRSNFQNVTASNNFGGGIYVYGASPQKVERANTFNSVTVSGNGFSNNPSSTIGGHGIRISTMYSTLFDIRVIGNKNDGIWVEQPLNKFAKVISHNNGGDGLHLNGASNSTIVGATFVGNGGSGLHLTNYEGVQPSTNNVFVNVTSVLNKGDGVSISDGGNSLIRTVSALNGGKGVYVNAAITNTAFTNVNVNKNATNCDALGLNTCPTGVSATDTGMTSTFTLKASTDTIYQTPKENRDLARVRDDASLADNTNAGTCLLTCGEFDSRLKTADTLLRNQLAVPTANTDVESHAFPSATVTFLAHANEIFGDGIGNDNGLCESNETCVYNPNIGAYQGQDVAEYSEVLGDNIGNNDGVCNTSETCEFVKNLGSYPNQAVLTDVTGPGKWEGMGITLKKYVTNGN